MGSIVVVVVIGSEVWVFVDVCWCLLVFAGVSVLIFPVVALDTCGMLPV